MMFRTKRTKIIDRKAASVICSMQWVPMPVTVEQVAHVVRKELARDGLIVTMEEAINRTWEVNRRMAK